MNALDEKMRSERSKTKPGSGKISEEANKTAQTKDQQIADQSGSYDLRLSNETAAMKTSALSAISRAGAINSEQMLQLVQSTQKLMTQCQSSQRRC